MSCRDLDERMSLRREAVGTEADPFGDAMLVAVCGAAEAIKVQPKFWMRRGKRLAPLVRAH